MEISGGSRISQTKGGELTPLFGQIFPKNYLKMKEIGWTGGWGSLRTQLRSWIRNIFHRLDILFCKRRKRQGPQFRDGASEFFFPVLIQITNITSSTEPEISCTINLAQVTALYHL